MFLSHPGKSHSVQCPWDPLWYDLYSPFWPHPCFSPPGIQNCLLNTSSIFCLRACELCHVNHPLELTWLPHTLTWRLCSDITSSIKTFPCNQSKWQRLSLNSLPFCSFPHKTDYLLIKWLSTTSLKNVYSMRGGIFDCFFFFSSTIFPMPEIMPAHAQHSINNG